MKMPITTLKDICAICGKAPQMGLHRPHSLHKTKRVVRPNLGQWNGIAVCAKCRKAMVKPEHVRKVQPALTETTPAA